MGEGPMASNEAEHIGPLEEAWGIFDARHVPYRLLMLGKMVDRLTVQHVRDLSGLSLAEWRVLVHLAVMGSKSASEVSAAALVDRAEVSRAVRALEDAGHLARVDNPRNRKSSLLRLTPSGQGVFDRVHLERRAFFDALTSEINADELAVLDELLLRMARSADRLARNGMGPAEKTP
jgi:DNA-binding MarR family transcriptional regulator